ncbi:DUF7674 family protein [Pontibacter anaerobius]|uniref:DUF7674 domain-containing protein n=1 Tax=Pontibacter anaerobius TaxID=2993940 RepID=A0ABT3R9I3_9BACT|nr:hypothetical protein [Pontibacter anaerobius]MCX2738446.1 hypothetical protein [Pontibacter anaerobius]
MVDEKTCLTSMLTLFPAFHSQYEEHVKFWKGESPFGMDMAEFSHFALDIIAKGTDKEVEKLVNFAEQMITEGNDEVNYAIKFFFLENITNRSGDRRIPLSRFTTRLKPKSFEFCRELDKHWGSKTEGID